MRQWHQTNEVIVDLAANTVEDLNIALGELITVEGVKSATVVRMASLS
jgi:hypothetical protein